MTTKLGDLIAELSPEDRADVAARKAAHLRAMADARRLPELRRAASVRQIDVAQAMRVKQNAVSQLESRNDWQLSTLSRYVASVGYRLEIALVDPSGDRVLLPNFRPWESASGETRKPRAAKKAAPANAKPGERRKVARRERAVASKGDSSNIEEA